MQLCGGRAAVLAQKRWRPQVFQIPIFPECYIRVIRFIREIRPLLWQSEWQVPSQRHSQVHSQVHSQLHSQVHSQFAPPRDFAEKQRHKPARDLHAFLNSETTSVNMGDDQTRTPV